MSIATEITRLQNAKDDLKTSINAKTDSSHQITNETIDDYADFVDSIETGGGGGEITKGVEFSDWNDNGYPTNAKVKGLTTIPQSYMTGSFLSKIKNITLTNTTTIISNSSFSNLSSLETINIPNTVTSIGEKAFYSCPLLSNKTLNDNITNIGNSAFQLCNRLALESLPNNLVAIGNSAFQSCPSISITQIPDGVTILNNKTFNTCNNIKKLSMKNVTSISGFNANSASITSSGLKQVWIGSAITNGGLNRYSFLNCSNLEKMYIDLPRATVESFTNYQYAFMNNTSKTGIIVCNDDAGFISKAEFDTLVIE